MYTPKVITDAVKEPITAAYLKLHSKVASGAAEDSLLAVHIGAARRFFENETGKTIHQKTFQLAFDEWPESPFVLPLATPLISVDSIIYTDSAGTPVTWPSTEYAVDTISEIGRVARGYSISYPSFTHAPLNPIVIQYKGGIPTAVSPAVQAEATEDIQQCVALLAGHFYDNRQALMFSDRGFVIQSQEVAFAARAIITQNIQWRFQ